jgi:hypothetical protein
MCRPCKVKGGLSCSWLKRGSRVCMPRRSGKQANCSQERLCNGDTFSHSNSEAEEHCKCLWPAEMAFAVLREMKWVTLRRRWRASLVVDSALVPWVSYSSIAVVACAPSVERMRMRVVSFLEVAFLAVLLLVCCVK